jgi:sulfatase maturation enzyme AslB (radical SAM superfamily)
VNSLEQIGVVELVLTSRCNLKCGYCFENEKKDLSMSWEIAQRSLDLALASAEPRPTVVFFGGEPTLEFETIRRAILYAEEKRPRWKRFTWSMVTNGMLLGKDEIDFLASHRVFVQISFDGVPEAQIFRGKGTFEPVDALLDTLRLGWRSFFKARVSVAMTLLPRTVPLLARSIDYFLAKRVPWVKIGPKHTFDPYWKLEMIDELDRQFSAVRRASIEHYRKTGSVPLDIFRKSGRSRVERPEEIEMCGVGSGTQIAVDVDGTTHGCAMFARSFQKYPSPFFRERIQEMEMGDVRGEALGERLVVYPEKVRAAEFFDDKQLKRSSYGECGTCRFLATCNVCPASIGHIPGNTDPHRVPDFLCAYNLISLKHRALFPLSRPKRDGRARGVA